MTKKELTTPPPLHFLFERIVAHSGDSFMDSPNWKELQYANHVKWLEPLIADGCLEQVKVEYSWKPSEAKKYKPRKRFRYYDFKPTERGLQWWFGERVKEYEKRTGNPPDLRNLIEPRWEQEGFLIGKPIGAELSFNHWQEQFDGLMSAAFLALREGLFKYESYYAYHWMGEESIRVTLTEKGMRYFDSLPRLELECA